MKTIGKSTDRPFWVVLDYRSIFSENQEVSDTHISDGYQTLLDNNHYAQLTHMCLIPIRYKGIGHLFNFIFTINRRIPEKQKNQDVYYISFAQTSC